MACDDMFREPILNTLTRTGPIALLVGLVWACFAGGLTRWPADALLVLWPSLGGHWVEVFYLNGLHPRLPATLAVRMTARVAVWFIGGIGLFAGMRLTAMVLAGFRPVRWPAWWFGGLAFIVLELVVHLTLNAYRLKAGRISYD